MMCWDCIAIVYGCDQDQATWVECARDAKRTRYSLPILQERLQTWGVTVEGVLIHEPTQAVYPDLLCSATPCFRGEQERETYIRNQENWFLGTQNITSHIAQSFRFSRNRMPNSSILTSFIACALIDTLESVSTMQFENWGRNLEKKKRTSSERRNDQDELHSPHPLSISPLYNKWKSKKSVCGLYLESMFTFFQFYFFAFLKQLYVLFQTNPTLIRSSIVPTYIIQTSQPHGEVFQSSWFPGWKWGLVGSWKD